MYRKFTLEEIDKQIEYYKRIIADLKVVVVGYEKCLETLLKQKENKMKRIILIVCLVFLATPVLANPYYVINNKYVTNVTNVTEENSRNKYGAELDAPNLVRINKDWTIGVEGGKDFNGTSGDEGYFAYGKATYSGTWFDFSKGE